MLVRRTLFSLWLAAGMLLSAVSPLALADGATQDDERIRLGMTSAERVQFLDEMRQMLASIQGIVAGIGEEDRERIIEEARYSGNRMARATPASLRQRLPAEFQAIGGPTHMLFEEIVIRAESDDMASIAELTGRTMQNCLACHAQFRAD